MLTFVCAGLDWKQFSVKYLRAHWIFSLNSSGTGAESGSARSLWVLQGVDNLGLINTSLGFSLLNQLFDWNMVSSLEGGGQTPVLAAGWPARVAWVGSESGAPGSWGLAMLRGPGLCLSRLFLTTEFCLFPKLSLNQILLYISLFELFAFIYPQPLKYLLCFFHVVLKLASLSSVCSLHCSVRNMVHILIRRFCCGRWHPNWSQWNKTQVLL